MHDVFIMSATRTAIGGFGGSLKDKSPIDLGIAVTSEAIGRSGLATDEIDHGIYGNVIHTEARDMYISRCITIGAGMADSSPALTVNRLCGSGLQAIVSATQLVQLGDASAAVAGGAEVMSLGGYHVPAMRWGARLGHAEMTDMMLGALHDPFGLGHMGITAENVAKDFNVTRADMDAFALASQKRAANAIEKGYFKDQITPVKITKKREEFAFDTDEHVRGETTADGLASLRPAFDKEGQVTAGNSSGINDGAAALILGNAEKVEKSNKSPLAKIISYGFGGVAPRIMEWALYPHQKWHLNELD